MTKDKIATAIVTVYLVVYTILFHADAPMPVVGTMFLVSPFLVVWMVYNILKHGKYNGRELRENEEWGYQDKPADFGNKIY